MGRTRFTPSVSVLRLFQVAGTALIASLPASGTLAAPYGPSPDPIQLAQARRAPAPPPSARQDIERLRKALADARAAERWDDVIGIGQRLLALQERAYGRNHAELADTLSLLALALTQSDQDREAEPLYRRALVIRERALGPRHKLVAVNLMNLASVLWTLLRPDEAEPLARRSIAIFEAVVPTAEVELAAVLMILAHVRADQKANDEAEALYRRALAIRERILGQDDDDTVWTLVILAGHLSAEGKRGEAYSYFLRAAQTRERLRQPDSPAYVRNLASLGLTLNMLGRSSEAVPHLQNALAMQERLTGRDSAQALEYARMLALTLEVAGRFADAEGLRARLVAALESAGDADLDLAVALGDLAFNVHYQGRYDRADPLYARAHAIRERVFGAGSPKLVTPWRAFAKRFLGNGMLRQAEPLYARVLALSERIFGSTTPEVATSLVDLASIEGGMGRTAEAQLHLARALDIRERRLGPTSPQTAEVLSMFVSSLSRAGRHAEAEPLMRRVLAIYEADASIPRERLAEELVFFANNAARLGHLEEAESAIGRALAIQEELYGKKGKELFVTLTQLANLRIQQGRLSDAKDMLYRTLDLDAGGRLSGPNPLMGDVLRWIGAIEIVDGRFDEAARLLGQAVEVLEGTFGRLNVTTISSHALLSRALLATGRPREALTHARAAWRGQAAGPIRSPSGRGALVEDWLPATMVMRAAIASLGTGPDGETPEALLNEAFRAGQDVRASGAAEALARGAARVAAGRQGLAPLVQDWERARERLASLDADFGAAAVGAGVGAQMSRDALLREREELETAATRTTGRLRTDFACFFDLVSPEPVDIAALQGTGGAAPLLKEDEALILLVPGRGGFDGLPGIVMAVTRQGTAWAELGRPMDGLLDDVARLRVQLDRGGFTRAPDTGSSGPGEAGHLGYDRGLAFGLYQALLGDPKVAELVAGKPKWLLAPQGALIGLPFAALVTRSPEGDDAAPADLRRTAWLGLERPLAILPSVVNLRTLRASQCAAPAAAAVDERTPFFGLGDPAFDGSGRPGAPDGAATDRPSPARSYFRDASPDGARIRTLPRLPGTQAEIRDLAERLGAGPESILLGTDATEGALRARDRNGQLGRARVVALATHGLIAGDLGDSLAEPGLALAASPGAAGSDDDGLLTASEAATLKLDAEWVILSACNTAAGDGRPDADGLTGLARAFLYAGARSLLVSHWRVRDDAAARLTVRAVAAAQQSPDLGRSGAFRASMEELVHDESADASGRSFAHPSSWAPFALVGPD